MMSKRMDTGSITRALELSGVVQLGFEAVRRIVKARTGAVKMDI